MNHLESECCLTLKVVCAAEELVNSSYIKIQEISEFNVYIMSNLNIPGMCRPDWNVHYWCMTFRSKWNIHMTSNKNIPGILGPKRC